MKISILCSNKDHPVNAYLAEWVAEISICHQVDLCRNQSTLPGGDLLFLISCSEVVKSHYRELYQKTLVIHASDLPHGKGWSPHIWQIIEGKTQIVISLLEADDAVDSGDIWHKVAINIPNTALYDEINHCIFMAEKELIDYGIKHFQYIEPYHQNSCSEPHYYPKRNPADSKIDPDKSISEQFDLLRVCDPDRFPAFFEYRGQEYKITLDKITNE